MLENEIGEVGISVYLCDDRKRRWIKNTHAAEYPFLCNVARLQVLLTKNQHVPTTLYVHFPLH